ncbi:MAG: O-antigen ligase family protein [Rhizomicrobium sp.]
MASDYALSYDPPRTLEHNALPVLSFVALLLLIFVGLDAFSPPLQQAAGAPQASQGDVMRQLAYLSVAGMIGIGAVQRFGFGALRALPVSMGLLLAWCLASAFWAPDPNIVLRRAGLEVILAGSLLLSVETVGAGKAFALWRWLLAAILLVNFLAIPLVPAARHSAGEIDPALIGNWRGLYGHKNVAGAVSAMTAILFLFSKNGWRNVIGIAVAAAACVFLVMTHSKSSAGFLVIALMGGLLYRAGWRDGLSRAILLAFAAILLVAATAVGLFYADPIARLFQDPQEFTGRAAIWTAELRYIAEHPLLGAGFGTLTDARSQSPLHNYVSGWVDAASHGHNGYLQVLVTIGGIGFVLAMLALVLAPMRRLWTLDINGDGFKPMLFALFVFAILHNVMESDFLEGDSLVWASLLLVIAALNTTARRHSLTGR